MVSLGPSTSSCGTYLMLIDLPSRSHSVRAILGRQWLSRSRRRRKLRAALVSYVAADSTLPTQSSNPLSPSRRPHVVLMDLRADSSADAGLESD
jgi:hypothetical protein